MVGIYPDEPINYMIIRYFFLSPDIVVGKVQHEFVVASWISKLSYEHSENLNEPIQLPISSVHGDYLNVLLSLEIKGLDIFFCIHVYVYFNNVLKGSFII